VTGPRGRPTQSGPAARLNAARLNAARLNAARLNAARLNVARDGYNGGMFLLFGLRTKDHLIASGLMTCEICGWQAPQELYKRQTRFTLFFVPLFPVSGAKYFLRCGHCQGLRASDAGVAGRLAGAVR
jgi:hypothetical protein